MIVLSLLTFLLIFFLLVLVHEAGHFWVGKACGIRAKIFSIGFGKPLYKWQSKGNTSFQIASIPLGGYVKFQGDMLPPDKKRPPPIPQPNHKEFWQYPLLSRVLVVLAGPVANFALALLLLVALYTVAGQPQLAPVIGKVQNNSAASTIGLKAGDRILALGDTQVATFNDIVQFFQQSPSLPFHILIRRDEAELSVVLDRSSASVSPGRLGIMSSGQYAYQLLSPPQALFQSLRRVYDLTVMIARAVGGLFVKKTPIDSLAGPVGIAKMSGEAARAGLAPLINFTALLSISLGLLNLLPIPALDGGHLLFYLLEGLIGKPLPRRFQELLMIAGACLLIALILFATWNDILTFFS